MIEEIPSDRMTHFAYRRDRYGNDGRFKVIRLLAGAGQGYALLVEDTWCGSQAVLKGLWWKHAWFEQDTWENFLERNKADQGSGLRAVYQAMQLTQQAPAVIAVQAQPSPTLESMGIDPVVNELFVVTEFVGVEGREVRTLKDDIAQRRDEGRPFSEDELIDLAEQLCRALHALHTRRHSSAPGKYQEYWIHADLKPENILVLGPPAQYVLIDYDAAIVDGKQINTTTAEYGPPAPLGTKWTTEREKASEKFDIYMLGATLAEALALARLDGDLQRLFYGSREEHGTAKKRLTEHGRSPIITTIVSSCLAEPDRRTPNVRSIMADLSRAREGAVLHSVLLGET